MAIDEQVDPVNEPNADKNIWERLKPPAYAQTQSTVKSANEMHGSTLTLLERLAMTITNIVGSMGFFFIIFGWTVLWCSYNILASEVPGLGWHAFDPFPAFVAYLLISNVIQLLLMPLIMVGQNLQGRHAEIRAELDFEINQKAEKEVLVILRNLEYNTNLMLQLMKHLECRVSEAEIRAFKAEKRILQELETVVPASSSS